MDINPIGFTPDSIAWIWFGIIVVSMFASFLLAIVGKTQTKITTVREYVLQGIIKLVFVTYLLFLLMEIT